jgi:hypothetical protein
MKSFVYGMGKRLIGIAIVGGLTYAFIVSSAGRSVSPTVQNAPAVSPSSKPNEELQSLTQDSENGLADAIRDARYSVDQSDDKFYAANPANRMHAAFEHPGDFKLRSSDDAESWQSEWKLKSIGHGALQQRVLKGEWTGSNTRIAANHRVESADGPIKIEESFENRPDGLEQVFVVNKSPRSIGRHSHSPLRLVLEIEGDLEARATVDGQAIDLIDESGEKILRYEKLIVWDANSRELSARMRTEAAGEVWLEVDDTDAVYPITVDPSFVQTQKLTRADSAAGDQFGQSLAYNSGFSSSFLAIGAPDAAVAGNSGQGAVYIFEYSFTTRLWTFKQKITASDGLAEDNFGAAIAVGYQGRFLIGAPNDNVGANLNQGSVYKFELSSSTGVWTQVLKIVATDGAADDNFGTDIVSVGSDSMFVSAPNDDVNDNVNQGSVYWINQATGGHRRRLNASDGQAGDGFGISIDGWEDFDSPYDTWLVVGAYRDDNGAATSQGSVYILQYDSSNSTWVQPQKLLAPDGALGDNFGVKVKLNPGFPRDLYIGATGDDIDGNSGEGSVYFYDRVSSVWAYDQKITASDGEPFGRFGTSIDTEGFFDNTVVIGAPFADIGANQNQGAVYFFTRRTINGDVVFRQSSKRSSPDGDDNDHFGTSVVLANDRRLIVGSPDDDVDADVDQGSVSSMQRVAGTAEFDNDFRSDLSIFRPSNGQWWHIGSNSGAVVALQFGTSTDRITPGDFTGDGKTDIAIWRPSNGGWYVLRSENNTFYAFAFGISTDVPAVGDFDGDAESDAAVYRSGVWYILRSNGGTTIQQFGVNGDVPVVGDYDDDGKADMAIFRPSNGQWWIQRSSGGTVAYTFGVSTDQPVQADYTGDGRTDVAVFRPSNGFWYVLRSENFSFYAAPFGTSTDIPAPGDYDGDGKADFAVFRPSEGTWYMNRSLQGILIRQFGAPGDRPVPSAFIP